MPFNPETVEAVYLVLAFVEENPDGDYGNAKSAAGKAFALLASWDWFFQKFKEVSSIQPWLGDEGERKKFRKNKFKTIKRIMRDAARFANDPSVHSEGPNDVGLELPPRPTERELQAANPTLRPPRTPGTKRGGNRAASSSAPPVNAVSPAVVHLTPLAVAASPTVGVDDLGGCMNNMMGAVTKTADQVRQTSQGFSEMQQELLKITLEQRNTNKKINNERWKDQERINADHQRRTSAVEDRTSAVEDRTSAVEDTQSDLQDRTSAVQRELSALQERVALLLEDREAAEEE